MHSYLVDKVTAPMRTLENGASENMGEEAESIQKETPSDELSERLLPQTSTFETRQQVSGRIYSGILPIEQARYDLDKLEQTAARRHCYGL